MYGESLDDAITSEFSGDEGRCLRMLSKDRLGVWATLVHKALTEGRLSADKEVLVRILGGADKGTVKAIARRYQQLFGAPLVLDLQEKLSGVLSGGLKAALISWVENEAIGEEERPPDPNLTPCEDATIEYFRVHSLLVNALDYITRIDAKRIRAACKGFGAGPRPAPPAPVPRRASLAAARLTRTHVLVLFLRSSQARTTRH